MHLYNRANPNRLEMAHSNGEMKFMKTLLTLILVLASASFANAHGGESCQWQVRHKNAELDRIEQDVIFNMNQASAELKQRPTNFACVQKDLLAAIEFHDQYADRDAELLALLQDDCDLTEYTALKSRVEGRVESGDPALNAVLRQGLVHAVNQAISLGQSCN